MAVAQHRHAVAHGKDLVQPVGDEDHRHAVRFQLADDAEKGLGLLAREGRCGLIHDDDLGVDAHRLDDLHHLLLRHGQRAHQPARVDLQIEFVKERLRVPGHLAPLHKPVLQRIPAGEDVLRHRDALDEVQLLVDDRDAHQLRLLGGGDLHLLAVEPDAAAVLFVGPGDGLHQRGLSRAVLAHQRVDFALFQGEIHVRQGFYTGKGLVDFSEPQDIFHPGPSFP